MATQALRVVISSDSEGDDPTYRAPFPFFGHASRARVTLGFSPHRRR
jgi:hypothetical protein